MLMTSLYKHYYYNRLYQKNCYGKSYGCGIGINGGRIGGWGIEGGTDRVVRNGIRDGYFVVGSNEFTIFIQKITNN